MGFMMIEKIKEENVWDFLKNDNKPIMIYGMGNGAEKIISTLDTYGVKVSEIFASDEFVRGHSFLGYKVLKTAIFAKNMMISMLYWHLPHTSKM